MPGTSECQPRELAGATRAPHGWGSGTRVGVGDKGGGPWVTPRSPPAAPALVPRPRRWLRSEVGQCQRCVSPTPAVTPHVTPSPHPWCQGGRGSPCVSPQTSASSPRRALTSASCPLPTGEGGCATPCLGTWGVMPPLGGHATHRWGSSGHGTCATPWMGTWGMCHPVAGLLRVLVAVPPCSCHDGWHGPSGWHWGGGCMVTWDSEGAQGAPQG